MDEVIVREFTDYNSTVSLVLDGLGFYSKLDESDRIIIKPNLLQDAPPPCTTDAACVEAVLRYIFDRKPEKEVIVLEGSGGCPTGKAFKGLGYDVATAQNVEQSVQIISKSTPDIIISDIKLPDSGGIDFLKTARKSGDIAFIFITDNSVKPDFETELTKVGNAEITKTHEVSEIVKLVENFI